MRATRSLGVLTCAALVFLTAMPALAGSKQVKKVRSARWAYEKLFYHPNEKIPSWLMARTRCLAVFPGLKEAAFGLGGSFGSGVVSCRNDDDEWSPPAFIKISEGSVGLQAGYHSIDLLLFFVSQRGAESLLKSQFTLGADASVAAGPLEENAGVKSNSVLRVDVYAYARSSGLFAGLAVDGSRMATSDKSIRRYYGHHVWPKAILFDHEVPNLPPEAQKFMDGLKELPWEPLLAPAE